MSVRGKFVCLVNKLVSSHTWRISSQNTRHYPRWTHRRPAGVVENNEYTKEEQERWKLEVERNIFDDSHSYTSKFKQVSSNVKAPKSDSISKVLLSEFSSSGEQKTFEKESQSVRVDNIRVYEQKNTREKSKPNLKSSTSDLDPAKDGMDSTKSPKQSRKERKAAQTLEKRRIYSEKELEKAIKLQKSAEKLGVPLFVDLETDDTILSQYMTNVKSKKRREKSRLVLLEGKRLIKDAVQAGVQLDAVFFSRIKDLQALDLPKTGVKVYKIIYKKLSMWSDVTTPQGVIAVLKIPDISKEKLASLPLTVVCDNIRDPGNLGTILRSCASIGCRKVILTKGCVDLWEPKVLRSAAGAHFKLSISQEVSWNDVQEAEKDSFVCIAESNISKEFAFGVTDDESETSDSRESDDSDDERKGFNASDEKTLPVVPYFSMDYTSLPSLVLIVGGETEGVSREAYQLASQTRGVRINIPMSNNVESLNSGIALSVIAFEVKKQFLMKFQDKEANKEDASDTQSNSQTSVHNKELLMNT